jgi:putative integral membrane protein (TIGR02587 family)
VRAFAGAYIFGIPLLFTMEMWWIGQYSERWKLLLFVVVALAANLGLTRVAGFKRQTTFRSTVNQAIDAVAVGVVAAIVMLLVLNRIQFDGPLDRAAGLVLVQAVPLSIGASVTNEVFGRWGERSRNGDNGDDFELGPWQGLFSDVGATIIGGVFIGFSIAPTEEVPMLAAGLEYRHLVALIIFSLVMSYGIVFASGFDVPQPQGPFQKPFTETAFAYAISLLVAAISLYLFDQIGVDTPLRSTIEQIVVLGVPTTVGGAAGRLVV